jgi:hypothetical protein
MPRNISVALLSITLAACASSATNTSVEPDLVVVCQADITRGTSQVTVKRRYEVDLATGKVVESIDQGNGWTPEATLQLQEANQDRLVFSGGGIEGSNIDSQTGEYRQADGRGVANGTCKKTAGKKLITF